MSRQAYQGSAEWLEERRTGIGSSDVPVLVQGDEEQWQRLWANKLGLVPDTEATETMAWGRRLEAVVAGAYTERTGEPVVRVDRIVRHPDRPYAMASLDRRRKRGRRIVEIKKVGFRTDEYGPEGSAQVPDRMAYQVQWQMAVAGYEIADVAVLFAATEMRIYTLGADRTIIDELMGVVDDHWPYVARGEMPPYPGPAALRPRLREDEIPADGDLMALVAAHETAAARLGVAETDLDVVKSTIRDRLVTAGGARGTLPDGRPFSVSYRPNRDTTVTDWSSVATGYRARLMALGVPEAEIDFAVMALTRTKPGNRPLIVHIAKEAHRHAA